MGNRNRKTAVRLPVQAHGIPSESINKAKERYVFSFIYSYESINSATYFFFLCLFFLRRFFLLWVAILCPLRFLPLGIAVNFYCRLILKVAFAYFFETFMVSFLI